MYCLYVAILHAIAICFIGIENRESSQRGVAKCCIVPREPQHSIAFTTPLIISAV